jgi:TatD DNase family protein
MKIEFVDAHTHNKDFQDDKLSLYHLSLEEILSLDSPPISHWAVGLHPWWLKELSSTHLKQCWQAIEQLASKASAIGETGIDRSGRAGDMERQVSWWKRHEKLYPQKPLIIHNVRASSDLLSLIPANNQRRTLLHDYQGGLDETRQWLKRNVYFSYGSALIRAHRGVRVKAIESLKVIPLDRLLLETDDGLEAIESIYDLAIQYLDGPSMGELKDQLLSNYRDFLGSDA